MKDETTVVDSETITITEEKSRIIIQNILKDYSLEHLTYKKSVNDENLKEKLARIALENLTTKKLSYTESEEINDHICSRNCGLMVDSSDFNK